MSRIASHRHRRHHRDRCRQHRRDDVDDFYQLTRKAATEVYALLNISRVGLIAQNELANMANIDAPR